MRFFYSIILCIPLFFSGLANAEWSMIVLPDTQNYMRYWPEEQDWLESQINWIRDQEVEFVLGTGDLTFDNVDWQWEAIKAQLENMNTPYIVPTGNHDYIPLGGWARHSWKPSTLYNQYFNETFPGLVPWQEGDWVNSYVRTRAPDGRRLLLLNLEDYPRPEAFAWATTILDQYPFDTVLVATHMNIEEGAADPVTGESLFARDPNAEPLWQWLKTTSNVEMIFNGHELDGDDTDIDDPLFFAVNWATAADDGHIIHEIGFNTQRVEGGGGSWLRTFTFNGSSVHAQTYSPHLNEWKTDHRNDFTVQISPIVNFTLIEWQENYGAALNGIDFLNWQRQATATPLAIPEPATMALIFIALLGMCHRLRKETRVSLF